MIVQKSGFPIRLGLSPQAIIVRSFIAAALAGTLLLCLPAARADGAWGNPLDSLFLAVSATCVTGLSTVPDLAATFSVFGQAVLLLLAQFGAIGIMSLGTFFVEALGGHASMKEERMLMDSLGVHSGNRARAILHGAVGFTLFWEALGSAVLALRLHAAYGYAPLQAVWHGLFHAVSGFCNAGLSLYPDSLARFDADPVVLLTEAALLVVGGIGFVVHSNVLALRPWRRNRLRRGRLSLHSRVVLFMTALLVGGGTLFFWCAERHGAFAGMPFWQSWLCAFFKAASTRTCGFAATPETAFGGLSRFVSMALMLIGGAPGSTAGGLKVTTVAVLAATVAAMVRNHEECELRGRTIPARIVQEAIAILMLGTVVLFSSVFLLHVFAGTGELSQTLVFEAVSACGTVGLSLGATPDLPVLSKLCVVACMFIGRLGPLAVALTIGGASRGIPRRYPEEDVVVG